jgi:predicted DsbA family dithiol-disulfide isomerase
VDTWLERIEKDTGDGLSVCWKAFSLEQQNSQEDPEFLMWEHPEHPTEGVLALVAAKAAAHQGEGLFLRFHRGLFQAKHDEGKDIADRDFLRELAEKAGLDLVRFEQDLDNKETWQAVGRDHIEAREAHSIFGVPSLVFGESQAVFVKLDSLPDSKREKISLFQVIFDMAKERPYLRELKKP